MLSKGQISHVVSLRMAKFREMHNEFIAEGEKIAGELLQSDYYISQLFANKDWLDKNLEICQSRHILYQEVSAEELSRISNQVTPHGVLIVVRKPATNIDLTTLFNDLVIVLDRMQDPGNMGTILRIADWFGIRHIVCSEDTVDIYNPKVIQASMGSFTRVKVLYTDLIRFLGDIPENVTVYGTMAGGKNLYEQKLKSPAFVIIGNESQGISKSLYPFIRVKIGIPAFSKGAESLNASVAMGIICSEFRRRSV